MDILREYFYFISQQETYAIKFRVSLSNVKIKKTQSTSTSLNIRSILSFLII